MCAPFPAPSVLPSHDAMDESVTEVAEKLSIKQYQNKFSLEPPRKRRVVELARASKKYDPSVYKRMEIECIHQLELHRELHWFKRDLS